jgi:hypothetical protein
MKGQVGMNGDRGPWPWAVPELRNSTESSTAVCHSKGELHLKHPPIGLLTKTGSFLQDFAVNTSKDLKILNKKDGTS